MASSTTVAALVAHLALNSGQFKRGMDQASAKTRSTAGTMSSAFSKLKGAAAALGASVVAMKMWSMAKENLAYADSLDAVARQIGATSEGLQELRFAADTSGSSAEAMDQALEQLSARLGDALYQSTSTAGTALERLGLDIKQLAGQPIDETFRAVAAAIANIPNPAARASLAMDLFGRSGLEMLRTIEGGEEGLDAAAERLKEIGGVIGSDDIAKMRAANDALAELSTAWRGMTAELTTAFAPAIKSVVDMFTSAIALMHSGLDELTRAMRGMTLELSAGLASTWELLKTGDVDRAQRVADEMLKDADKAYRGKDPLAPPEQESDRRPWLIPEAFEKVSDAIRDSMPDLTGAMEKGSREAISAIVNARRETPELAEAKKQTSLLEEIRRAVEGGRLPDVAAVPL